MCSLVTNETPVCLVWLIYCKAPLFSYRKLDLTFYKLHFILEVVICSFFTNVSLVYLILTIIEIYNTATETFM